MLSLTVTEDEQGSGLQPMPVEEILFIQTNLRETVAVHAQEGVFYTVGPLRFWESAFKKAGLNFFRLDRGILANLNKIECVNPDLKLAYFGFPVSINTKRCTISEGRYKQVIKQLCDSVPLIYGESVQQ